MQLEYIAFLMQAIKNLSVTNLNEESKQIFENVN